MSNQRFIELSSSYRNRNIYPNPSEFEVSFVSPTVLSNLETIRGIYNINNKIFSSSNNSADTVIKGTIDYLFGNVFDTGSLYFDNGTGIITSTNTATILSSTINPNVIVTDYFPFNNGNPGHGYSVIFPQIKIDNKILNANQYINTKYFYGEGFDNKNVVILPNSSTLIKRVILDTKKYKSKKLNFPKDTTIRLRQPTTYY